RDGRGFNVRTRPGVLLVLQCGPTRPRAESHGTSPLLSGPACHGRACLEGDVSGQKRGGRFMSRWRIAVVAGLLFLPLLLWPAVGSYYLWTIHWVFTAWWIMAACMAAGYLLAWYWQANRQLLRPPEFSAEAHWTERDTAAWKIVEARAKAAEKLDPARLS